MEQLLEYSGGRFRIDLEQAPQYIANLYKARDRLDAAINSARKAGQAKSPGDDVVSRNAVEQINKMAVGPEGLADPRPTEIRPADR